jgi:hypothetical protein
MWVRRGGAHSWAPVRGACALSCICGPSDCVPPPSGGLMHSGGHAPLPPFTHASPGPRPVLRLRLEGPCVSSYDYTGREYD